MNRNNSLDIIKGLGICFVVLGHCGFPYTDLIYLFHISLFFIVAGFCFDEKHTKDANALKTLIVKRIKSLYLPYVAINILFLCLHNYFIYLNIYTNNPDFILLEHGNRFGLIKELSWSESLIWLLKILFFGGGGIQLAGYSWFLRTLFLSTVTFSCAHYILNKYNKGAGITVFSWICLICGFILKIFGVSETMGITNSLSVIFLLDLGYKFKRLERSLKFNNSIKLLVVILSFFLLFFLNKIGTISIGANSYVNPVFFALSSLTGWFFVYFIAWFLEKIKPLSYIIAYIGKHSLIILLFHFLSFKLVTYFIIKIHDMPKIMLACFPTIGIDYWWPIYALAGIFIPLLLERILIMVSKIYKGISLRENPSIVI